MSMSLNQLADMVAGHYGCSVDALKTSSKRNPVAVEARHLCWLLLREHTSYSYPAIGRGFGFGHDTVLRGSKKLRLRLKTDQKLANTYRYLERKFLKACPQKYPPWTELEKKRAKKYWLNPKLSIGLAAKKAGFPRHLFTKRCLAFFGERHSLVSSPQAINRKPKQVSKWPNDMPRFEDHPDAGTPKDYSFGGKRPSLTHSGMGWRSPLVGA